MINILIGIVIGAAVMFFVGRNNKDKVSKLEKLVSELESKLKK